MPNRTQHVQAGDPRWDDPEGLRNHCFVAHFHATGREELVEFLEMVKDWIETGRPIPEQWRAPNCPMEMSVTVSETNAQRAEREALMNGGRY